MRGPTAEAVCRVFGREINTIRKPFGQPFAEPFSEIYKMDLKSTFRRALFVGRAALLGSAGLLLLGFSCDLVLVLFRGLDLPVGTTLVLLLTSLSCSTVAAIDLWALWRAVFSGTHNP